jgi:hypothetical protein
VAQEDSRLALEPGTVEVSEGPSAQLDAPSDTAVDASAPLEPESAPTGDAETFEVPEQMAIFEGHVGTWEGMTKTAVTEAGEQTLTRTRSKWTAGYLLGGHAFEIRGFSYGPLGRTKYRWQYTYDALKQRYMGAYYDSHGRTYFCEGKINEENTKLVWRLLAPPGDMHWHAETDLHPEDGLQTNGMIKSETYEYDMVYSSVFKRS